MSASPVTDVRVLALMVQVAESKQACAGLQQQLQQQTEAHSREVSDLIRMTNKAQDLQFDLGNMRQSLQAISSLLESVLSMPRRSHVSLWTHPCCFMMLLQNRNLANLLHVTLTEKLKERASLKLLKSLKKQKCSVHQCTRVKCCCGCPSLQEIALTVEMPLSR